ncbi:dihydrofolate reductase [Blattabacterium cuenoti]|uniref:dihydrofolate reductase n=1 Tax=Blattabacterium cuenoti TaxID=1653831 RepID=UPI00163C1D2F|nr:dihydrofolate reductase [Blattabacterium cuenoti]
MTIILIASVSKNGFIGKNNKLMWHLPNDLKRFKKLTLGEVVLMGRKTFESIGKILPKRKNIILTKKNIHFLSNHNIIKNNRNSVKIFSSLKEIYHYLTYYKKIFVIGGEKIYNSTIKKANIIELTIVHEKFYGDARFPKIDLKKWKKIYEFSYEKDKHHLYDYSFIRYERKNTSFSSI